MSCNQPGDEILKRKSVEGPLRTTRALDDIVDLFHCWVSTMRIVLGIAGILLVEDGLVLFETLCLGVVDVPGKGNKSRRRRSVGKRHFVWRMG